MAKLDFYFDTQKVNEDISNWRDLEIELSFENNEPSPSVRTPNLEFSGDLSKRIREWNDIYGIYEAPPFRIDVCGSNKTIFDGGINVADCSASYDCDIIVAPLRDAGKIDFLNDRATSFRFEYLASLTGNAPGRITQSDYVLVPYVISSIPDYVNVMVAGISLFTLVKELKDIFFRITDAIKHVIASVIAIITASTPTVNVGVALALKLLADILRLILLMAYAVFIIIAIVELFSMIFNNLIQRVKYKKTMRVRDSFQKACDYLGLEFRSTLLTDTIHKDEVIMPVKIAASDNKKDTITSNIFGTTSHKNYDDLNHPLSTGYFDGTFADLIMLYEKRFNAKVKVIGGILYFETWDYWKKYASYTLPNINFAPYTTNACALTANYLLIHEMDDLDMNTYDNYDGTSAYMTLTPDVIKNSKNLLLKGITEERMGLSLAKTKTELTSIEHFFKTIYDTIIKLIGGTKSGFSLVLQVVIDGWKQVTDKLAQMPGFNTSPIVSVINTLSNFPNNPYDDRIGMMLLSSDFTSVPKVLIVTSTGKPHPLNSVYTSARYLMDTFHFSNFAVRKTDSYNNVKNDYNQWIEYKDKEIPFCCSDFEAVTQNNFIKTYDQKEAKVESLVWNPYSNKAQITFKVKQKFTSNLKNSYIIDGKQ